MVASLIYLVIYVIIVGLVLWLMKYLMDALQLPEPIHRGARVGLIAYSVLIIGLLLLNLIGVIDGGVPGLGRR